MQVLRAFGSALLAALLLGAAGCGGDGADGVDSGAEEQLEFGTEKGDLNPEDVRASDPEVAAGFAELTSIIAAVEQSLGTDEAGAIEAQEKILPVWESILGAVKANDPASYETLSRAVAYLISASNDAPKATVAAAVVAFRTTSIAYLRVHTAGSASPKPGADAEPGAGTEPTSSGSPDDDDAGTDY